MQTKIFSLLTALVFGVFSIAPLTFAADTISLQFSYTGVIVDSGGNPVTEDFEARFSFWKSSDIETEDINSGDGSINTGAVNYAGHQESQLITPNREGGFTAILSGIPSSIFQSGDSVFLQVEAKEGGAADTAYIVLDPDMDLSTDFDRELLGFAAYAANAEMLDGADVGTAAGDLVVLESNGKWSEAYIPGGTQEEVFVLDSNNSGGNLSLQFGATLAESLAWDATEELFILSDDLAVQGNLETQGDVIVGNATDNGGALQFGQTLNGRITYDNLARTFDFDANRLANLVDPTDAQDAATKYYVDEQDGILENYLLGEISSATTSSIIWYDPVEHSNQFFDGASGGLRAGGKIFVEDESLVAAGDTIILNYDSGSTFTLIASDTPVATNGQFKSGAVATDNADLAASILAVLTSYADAADYDEQSAVIENSLYLVHDNVGLVGDGTLTFSGSGFASINPHSGKSYGDMVDGETHLARADYSSWTWNDTDKNWVQISADTIPDATTEVAGKVELAEDSEVAAGLAVQANDSRLHDQNTDTGTDAQTFVVNSDGTYTLTIDSTDLTESLVITGADLAQLKDLASSGNNTNIFSWDFIPDSAGTMRLALLPVENSARVMTQAGTIVAIGVTTNFTTGADFYVTKNDGGSYAAAQVMTELGLNTGETEIFNTNLTAGTAGLTFTAGDVLRVYNSVGDLWSTNLYIIVSYD